MGSLGSRVSDAEYADALHLLLDIEVPVLGVRGLEIGADEAQGRRRNKPVGGGERVAQRSAAIDRDREVWRIEIERRIDIEHAGVIVDSISATEHRMIHRRPGKAHARVVARAPTVGSGTRDPVGSDLHRLSGGKVECRHAIGGIGGRRVVFNPQSQVQRQVARDLPIVLHIGSRGLAAKGLGPGVLRLDGIGRQPQQEVAHRGACERAGEIHLAAAIDFDIAIFLKIANFAAHLNTVRAANHGEVIGQLIGIVGAVDGQRRHVPDVGVA